MTDELWTIEQLSDRVAKRLADNNASQRNGRVTDLPNGRTIRWYTTIGLVDRPAATRGRIALYGERHLLQLVAVKKLQAIGLTLAEIQGRLLGATEDELAKIADSPAIEVYPVQVPIRTSEAFWRPHARSQRTAAKPETVMDTHDTVSKPVFGVRLGDSVTVVLDAAVRAPSTGELAEIRAAAAPLLELLGRMGLASTPREVTPQ